MPSHPPQDPLDPHSIAISIAAINNNDNDVIVLCSALCIQSDMRSDPAHGKH